MFLEERRIPYRVERVPLNAYGYKPTTYLRKIEGGKLPAIELDGSMQLESLEIIRLLDRTYPVPVRAAGNIPVEGSLAAKQAEELLALERKLQSDWFSLVFYPQEGDDLVRAHERLRSTLHRVDDALAVNAGGWFLHGDAPSIVDIMYSATMERLIASSLYWRGLRIRGTGKWPNLERWLEALEARPSYVATKADWYSLVTAIPSQNGPGYWSSEAAEISARICGLDGGWDLPDPSQGWPLDAEPLAPLQIEGGEEAARHEAAYRLVRNHGDVVRFAARGASEPSLRWHAELAGPDHEPNEDFYKPVDVCLRHVVAALLNGVQTAAAAGAVETLRGCCAPPALAEGWEAYIDLESRDYYWHEERDETTYTFPSRQLDNCIAYLRDRIGVPRDMSAAAARTLRAHLNWAIALLRYDESGAGGTSSTPTTR
jgi:glutathione S-transferase